ncbi:BatD family protein [Zooshikella harenae]|uniref:Protein BatD n=1 Tax=Zooshikella harenae TaxID=2827238 RepID=A0ABS5ZBC1_9GAMM|nr:BatD family protein [Zooshikella harenae]MBU2711356.1 protein BatD [Zooshikella harenae]
MVKHDFRYVFWLYLRLNLLLCCVGGLALPSYASLTASVDRTTISENDTVELTLRSDKQQFFNEPDLTPLKEHFSVLSTQQRSQYQSVNGKSQAWTNWIVTLKPKRRGYVVIPPIELDGERSQPITLDVKKSNKNIKNGNVDVFMESHLDKEEIFVQGQALLTVQIFHSVPFYSGSQITELDIPEAIVKQVGDPRSFERIINGKRFRVIEVQYAIFPQKSGEITIPQQTFTATKVFRQQPFDRFFNSTLGKPVQVNSAPINLSVLPTPKDYPKKQPWLPASDITLKEKWSGEREQLQVGDSITRTITVTADGMSSAQLPPLPTLDIPGLKTYPDQTKTEDHATANGIVGRRQESVAIVPTKPGTYNLPAIKYTWFDTAQQRIRTAKLPARTLQVIAAPGSQQSTKQPKNTSPVTTTPDQESRANIPQNSQSTDNSTGSPINAPQATGWMWLTLLFATLWVCTLLLWWFKSKSTSGSENNLSVKQATESESSAFNSLKEACQQHDFPMLCQVFLVWSQYHLNAQQATTLVSCLQLWQDKKLEQLFSQLQQSRYGKSTLTEEPKQLYEQLLQQVKQLRSNHAHQEDNALPPLYPQPQ